MQGDFHAGYNSAAVNFPLGVISSAVLHVAMVVGCHDRCEFAGI
jgi:hypothetical protein